MKNLILLSILFTAVLWSGKCEAQCSAPLTITPTANPGEVDFEYDLIGVSNPADWVGELLIFNTTTSTGYPNLTFWQGNTLQTYQFVENGTYDLTSYMYDSLTSCVDTILYSYTVTGVTNTSCNASFNIVNDSLITTNYIGYNYSTGTNLTYFWDFGDGGTSTDQYPVHTFLSVGTFNVCLMIDDGNGCLDTACQSITVTTKASQTTLNIYDPQTAGLEAPAKFDQISVYPNPTEGNVLFSFNANDMYNAEVVILDITGKIIASQVVENASGSNQIDFDLTDVAPGVYFWRLNNEASGKVIIR